MIYDKGNPNEVTNSSHVAPATRAELRRERITTAARTLFAENGFHNTGIAQIAKQSGILVGQIYRDFANKEEIVAEIVEHDLKPFLKDDALAQAVADGDVVGVRAWIAHCIGDEPENDARLVAEIIAESSRNDRIAAIFQSVQERLQRSIMAALHMLAPQDAKHRQRAILADVILTMSAGVFQRRMGQSGAIDTTLIAALTAIVDREIDLLCRDR